MKKKKSKKGFDRWDFLLPYKMDASPDQTVPACIAHRTGTDGPTLDELVFMDDFEDSLIKEGGSSSFLPLGDYHMRGWHKHQRKKHAICNMNKDRVPDGTRFVQDDVLLRRNRKGRLEYALLHFSLLEVGVSTYETYTRKLKGFFSNECIALSAGALASDLTGDDDMYDDLHQRPLTPMGSVAIEALKILLRRLSDPNQSALVAALIQHVNSLATKGEQFPLTLLHAKELSSKMLCKAICSAPKFDDNIFNVAADTIKYHHSKVYDFTPDYLQDGDSPSEDDSPRSHQVRAYT